MKTALVIVIILFFRPSESSAKGADAFTPHQQSTHSERNRNLSSRAANKPNKNGPGKLNGSDGGGDDGNGMPEYPKAEAVQETENRVDNIDEYIARMN